MVESVVSRYFSFLDQRGRTFNVIAGVLCSILISVFDAFSPAGYELQFLYLLPVTFTTWFAGRRAGLFISIIPTIFLARYHLIEPVDVAVWNILSVLGIFYVTVIMLSKIRELLEAKSLLARTDSLTGAINHRAFKELLEYETLVLQRERTSFSVAYLDVDDFKRVNNQFGHSKGDAILKGVVSCITQNIRKTDVIARMGGDEFAVFFPGTGQESVKVVARKIFEDLNEYSKKDSWPTTVSMGVVTCNYGLYAPDDIITAADKVMYEVKNSGKNDVRYILYPEEVNDISVLVVNDDMGTSIGGDLADGLMVDGHAGSHASAGAPGFEAGRQ